MKTQNYKVEYGELIYMTQGVYSDYKIEGHLVMLWSGHLSSLLPQFIQDIAGKDKFLLVLDRTEVFVSWLVANEYAAPLKVREVYVGEYNDFMTVEDWDNYLESMGVDVF